ncbi:hypothetical protein B0H19DRAFT_1364931 [Mycena capillaripes]|nr:hypothetical protein B0H19DRAFT_1364931 [Mycena capillaripes]
MPRVATTSTFRTHKLPTGGRIPPCPPLKVRCPEPDCPWSFKTPTDLRRHTPRHMSPEERERQMYKCPEPGCTHKSLQKSNLETHYVAKHTGLKPHVCKQCTYCAADPSCLHRHMRAIHAYVSRSAPPRKRSAARASFIPATVETASPSSDYAESSTSSWSVSPSPASSTDYLSPSVSYSPSASFDDQYTSYSPLAMSDALLHPHSSASSPNSSTHSSLPSSTHASLPASPSFDSSNNWKWDDAFESGCFAIHAQIQTQQHTTTPASWPAMQHPAEGVDFFAPRCDASASAFEGAQPLCEDALLHQLSLLPSSVYDPTTSYLLDPSLGVQDFASVFGEWSDVLC